MKLDTEAKQPKQKEIFNKIGANIKKLFCKIKDKIKNDHKSQITLIIAVLVIIGIVVGGRIVSGPTKVTVVTSSQLEKIVHVSDLYSYEAVYNGVAQVMNEKRPEQVEYYVSYESKVKARIDFSQIDVKMDRKEKQIIVYLPPVTLDEPIVELESMDFIFRNRKAETSTVASEAYDACKADAAYETNSEETIYSLAEQNTENIITALLKPFMEQMDEDYTLVIQWEEEA